MLAKQLILVWGRGFSRGAFGLAFLALMSPAFAQGTIHTTAFQATPGIPADSPHRCRSAYVRFSTAPSSLVSWTTEGQDLLVQNSLGYSFVDFPHLVGQGGGRIPPGARIVSATLELYATNIVGSIGSGVSTPVEARILLDPSRLGTWHEPEAPGFEVRESGVTYVERDARSDRRVPWDAAGTLAPTTNVSHSDPLVPPSSNPTLIVNLGTPRQAQTVRANEWHAFDVTEHVRYWVEEGRSNQGWMLTTNQSHDIFYASDDHANSSLRPILRVTWDDTGATPSNHVPVPGSVTPADLLLAQGGELAFFIFPFDADGPAPEVVITGAPRNGVIQRLNGFDAWSYRPDPEFSGVDELTYVVRDGVSVSFPKVLSFTVLSLPGQVLRVFQEGVSPASQPSFGATRCVGTLARAVGPGFGLTFAEQNFYATPPLGTNSGRQGFLSYPNLFGPESQRIPPGARIVSASLQLRSELVPLANLEHRVLEARRILDPFGEGLDWADVPGLVPGGRVTNGGVSYSYPDERTAPEDPWWIPGGNPHPAEGASVTSTPESRTGDWFALDVTAAVQAWSDGAPNLGWVLRHGAPQASFNRYWTDDAPVPTDRPRLVVHYLAPGTSLGPLPVAPHADAGPDQIVYVGERVTLDGRGSSEPLNPGLSPSLIWLQTAGATVSLSAPTSSICEFTAPSSPQEIEFFLGAISSNPNRPLGTRFSGDKVRIRVLAQPGGTSLTPVRIDGGGDRTGAELRPMTLTAQLLSTGNPPARTIRWTQVDGPLLLEPTGLDTLTPSFRLPPVSASGQSITLDVTVTEEHGSGYISRHRDEVRITITNPTNRSPIANAGLARTVENLDWVVLDASQSVDPDGHPVIFSWTQIAGPAIPLDRYVTQGTAAAVRLPFQVPASLGATNLVFEVAVTDLERTGTSRVTLTVDPIPNSFQGSITANPFGAYRNEMTPLEARHLLRRMGAGWHPDDVAVVRQVGLPAFVNAALALDFASPPSGRYHTPPEVMEEAFERATNLVAPAFSAPFLNQPQFDLYPQLHQQQATGAWMALALRSPNFLRERLAMFWHQRFSVSARSLPIGQQQWIIPHMLALRDLALEPYPDILRWFVRDPVTLAFIDGFDNLRFAPNENFAREYLELFTLGVLDPMGNPIYTQLDVKDAARAFTGWRPTCYTLNPQSAPSCYPGFVPFFHDSGSKMILGVSGDFDDFAMVDLVTQDYQGGRPAARDLARDLLEEFIVAEPSAALTDALATVILNAQWDMEQIFRTLFQSRAMFAPQARKSIVSAPLHWVNGILRTLRIPLQTTDIASQSEITFYVRRSAQEPMNPLDVDGWPKGTEWIAEDQWIQRFNLLDLVMEYAVQPSVPAAGDQPGYSSTPLQFHTPWLPPTGARFSEETVEQVARLLDIDLARSPHSGALQSEFDLFREYLDVRATFPPGTPPGTVPTTFVPVADPFDGDDPVFDEKILGLIVLLFEHPNSLRN